MIWKKITDFECHYEVSDEGEIKSLSKRNYGNILYKSIKNEYYSVNLWKDNKMYTKYVHRLVAKEFVPNPLNLREVNHKWGNKLDNRAIALEWNTSSENQLHAYRLGLQTAPNKKKVLQFSKDGKFIKEFESISEAGRRLSISPQNISSCCNNIRKLGGNFIWKFKN
jgi:hypothetical protein